MARIKLAYIGGSTRAPGTIAPLVHQGENFQGSEVVLIDIDASHLQLVKTLANKLARNYDIDLKVSCTAERRAGLQDCDAVLTSFRPGGFEARYPDEAIPLNLLSGVTTVSLMCRSTTGYVQFDLDALI